VFETISRILQSGKGNYHQATSLSACVSTYIAESSTSAIFSPVQFRILLFGDEGSHSLLFPHVQEISHIEKRDLSKIHFGPNG
jgi:hypothetical protein